MKKELSPEARRRRNEFIIIGIISILILIFTTIEMKFPQIGGKIPFANNIVIFSLININIILILLLIFLVIRNLVKLIFERKRKVLGARLRTKLVVAFVSLSLIPTILLFFVAVGFITNSVEHWFSAQVEQSLQGSLEVAQTYYRDFAKNTVSTAQQISKTLSKQGSYKGPKEMSLLREQLEVRRKEYHLSTLGIFLKEGRNTIRVEDPSLQPVSLNLPSDLLEAGFSGKEVSRILSVGEGEIIMGIAPLFNLSEGGEVMGVVAASHFIPKSLTAKMREISHAFVEYKQLKILKKPIKFSYMMALLMVTLLIVFSATWFGFHLAKDITVPIKDLAEATHRIATGDLNFRIKMKAADEIGLLVQSFNQMTEDLQVSRAELEQRKKYMEIVLKNVAAGVISIDEEGNVTTINTSAEEMLEIKGEAVLDKKFSEALPKEYVEQLEPLLGEIKSSGLDSIERQLTVNWEGKSLSLLINLTTLRDEEGKPLGVLTVFDDLTQLMKAQRMAAWREVARRIAHEIKNPLTPIQLSAQRLRKRYLEKLQPDGAVFDECTRTIVKQVEELKGMVNEFSNFARMPASQPTPNQLNDIIQETLVLFKEAHKRIKFEFVPNHLPVMNVDRDQMKRVIINLIKNSLTAIENEGKIRIQTNYDHRLQIARLEVSDDGRGIPDEDKERLFEPYFSTRKSGMGLGLTIVNAIISDHNGYIRVRDNKPRGATFLIELPVRV
ncbi:MAG: PAS domain-containing sensor histidine kinase [Deltaproteobacteria bacterium RBG_19FT_COMBO_46_12]|nr:MAG: PAS domain-containing sensor histidine kinase [Deltaproteobacteria bacterium RBG_19FT_COMBO_46_12]